MFKFSLGSFAAFPVFGDLLSTFDWNIQVSLYCQVYTLLVFFELASDQAERQSPWASCILSLTLLCDFRPLTAVHTPRTHSNFSCPSYNSPSLMLTRGHRSNATSIIQTGCRETGVRALMSGAWYCHMCQWWFYVPRLRIQQHQLQIEISLSRYRPTQIAPWNPHWEHRVTSFHVKMTGTMQYR